MEAASGVSVAEVFATVGKDEFRKLETQVLGIWNRSVILPCMSASCSGLFQTAILVVVYPHKLIIIEG